MYKDMDEEKKCYNNASSTQNTSETEQISGKITRFHKIQQRTNTNTLSNKMNLTNLNMNATFLCVVVVYIYICVVAHFAHPSVTQFNICVLLLSVYSWKQRNTFSLDTLQWKINFFFGGFFRSPDLHRTILKNNRHLSFRSFSFEFDFFRASSSFNFLHVLTFVVMTMATSFQAFTVTLPLMLKPENVKQVKKRDGI